VNDAELVALAREGDHAAFGELVDRHRGAVYRAALTVLRSPADAEDAAQDAFVLAYRRLASFRGDSSFRTWLLTIAWRQAINRRRMSRVWRALTQPKSEEEADAMLASIVSSSPTPEQSARGDQLRAGIRDAIRRLPAKLRHPLLLAQAGEYGYGEIGAMLKVPLGTIKWRVSEARRRIRVDLEKRGLTHAG
jgi:RNA polymerase sigma-70 factor (ECF subfamily)